MSAKTKAKTKIGVTVRPMLAKLVPKPFDAAGWVYEEKYDGIRILAYKEGSAVRLISRNGIDRTHSFPRIADAIAALKPATLLLDGEVVAFDAAGISRFQLLQASKGDPAYAVFDCLFADGKDLRREKLEMRRAEMEKALKGADKKILFASRRLQGNGIEAFKEAKKRGLEGLVAKDAASTYVGGRSAYWMKVKVHQEDEFVIGGYTRPEGARKYFGALLVGAYADGGLKFTGKVGTGFSRETLAQLYKRFRALKRANSPFKNPPREPDVTWIDPNLVGQFAYQEWTADGKLRQPVFLGLRDDKSPREVRLQAVTTSRGRRNERIG